MKQLGRPCLTGLLAGWLCAAPAAGAEPRVKKPKSGEPAAILATAQLRVWKDVLASDRPVKITLRQGKKTMAELRIVEGLQFLEYQEIPSGPLVIEITDESEGNARLASTNAVFEGGDFFTLLLQENDGRLGVEIIDDASRPEAATGELTVRSFAPILTSLEVKIGSDVRLKLTGKAPFARLRGLALRTVQIDTTGMEADGKVVNWANELDFKKIPRATLLIVPDAYGRIRPRLVVDGAAQ